MHEIQRLSRIITAGVENNAAFRAAYDRHNLTAWQDFSSPPVDDALLQGLASRLYNFKPDKQETALLRFADGGRRVGEILLERCYANRIPTLVEIYDTDLTALILKYTDIQGAKNLANLSIEFSNPVTTIMAVRAGTSDGVVVGADSNNLKAYSSITNAFQQRIISGEVFFTLTKIPSPKTAELDGMDYQEYLTLFFEMCDQPWKHIGAAQKLLIAELDAAKELRFTNNDGTDITGDIDGMTFCNSLVAKNVPGSEIFSGFRRDSLQGKIVSKGRFAPPNKEDAIITNLTMEFDKGKLIHWHADEGQEFFEAVINIDEGARYTGEIGIGTNPWLRRHVINSLLVEKIGGSFHVALGAAYSFKTYEGAAVSVDNGNRSKIHWDITSLLGDVYVDGRKIMEDGVFLNPAYDVLNRGWAAVPVEDRPDYWKNHPVVLDIERRPAKPVKGLTGLNLV